jgi:hypothetical protein
VLLPRSYNFIDISSINGEWIANGIFWIFAGKSIDYTWKRLQIPIKSRQFYFGLRGLKYQFLYNYEGWKISRKRKDLKCMNYEMSKKELQHYCQIMLSYAMANPNMDDDSQRILWLFVKQAYPDRFRAIFGETKSEIQARLNIERFFQNVFV